MINDSRMAIYEYLEGLFTTITENVYLMEEPKELTDDDLSQGFIVINVGDIVDASEFSRNAYGFVRAFVTAYIPPISRGRLNVALYSQYEDAINNVVDTATHDNNPASAFWVDEENDISANGYVTTANNGFHTFIKSFLVMIDNQPIE